jgi:hypothetical protein
MQQLISPGYFLDTAGETCALDFDLVTANLPPALTSLSPGSFPSVSLSFENISVSMAKLPVATVQSPPSPTGTYTCVSSGSRLTRKTRISSGSTFFSTG